MKPYSYTNFDSVRPVCNVCPWTTYGNTTVDGTGTAVLGNIVHNYIFQGSIHRWSSQGLSDHTSRQGTGLTERNQEPHELEHRVGVRNVRTSAAKLPPELEPIRANSQKITGPIAELEHTPISIRRKPLAGTQTSKRQGDSVSPLLAELGTGCRSPAATLGSDRHSNHAMSRHLRDPRHPRQHQGRNRCIAGVHHCPQRQASVRSFVVL